jgi:glycolate oxidase iron-sulfur subunit
VKDPAPKPRRFLDEEKSLACIHCGLCLSSCPTYLETGNENDSPRGRIYLMRALQDDRLSLSATPVRHLDLCLGCRACEAVCPSGVEYGALLEATRDHIEKSYRRPVFQIILRRIVIEQIFPFPRRMKLFLWPAIALKRLGVASLLPKFMSEGLSLIPDDVRGVSLPETSLAGSAPKRGRVGFIRGCVMSVMFGRTNAASISLLNRLGYDVLAPLAQTCCGALYEHGGKLEQARACARKNIEVFEQLDLDAIIINAAGCGSTLKEYHHLLQNDPVWSERARIFSHKVQDLTQWLARPEHLSSFPAYSLSETPDPIKVTCHDACHLAHAQRITQAPRQLLRAMVEQNFVEIAESDVCCGSAGSYNLTEPEMAERLQKRKTEKILASGARVVVTTNPGCILQIQAGLKKAGAGHVRVMHIADFLEEQFRKLPETPDH